MSASITIAAYKPSLGYVYSRFQRAYKGSGFVLDLHFFYLHVVIRWNY